MGQSLITISIGSVLAGVINYITKTAYGWLVFMLFFAVGIVIMNKAQKKYNGSWF